MKTTLSVGLLAAGLLAALPGCTFPSSTSVVKRNQANQMQTAEVGTVIKVRDVAIEGRRTELGHYGGAVVGGALAMPKNGVSNTGQALGVAAASVAGAVVGEATEEYVTRARAQEITVQFSNGDTVIIVQEAPPEFRPGDRVQVIHSPGGARVAMNQDP